MTPRLRMFPVVVVSLLLSVLLASDTFAQADPAGSKRVVLLIPRSGPVASQIRDELRLLDFEVITVTDAPTQVRPTEVSEEFAAHNIVLLDVDAGLVAIWVVDRASQTTVTHSVPLGDFASSERIRVMGVRVSDQLQASRRELASLLAHHADVSIGNHPKPTHASFAFALGPAVTFSPSGATASGQIALLLTLRWRRFFGFGIRSFLPALPARVNAAAGRVRVYPTWITAGIRGFVTPRGRRVQASFGLAVGPGVVAMRGSASAPNRGRRDAVPVFLAEVDGSVALELAPHWRVMLDASMGVTVPRAGVRVTGRREATWGAPIVSLMLGPQLSW